MSMAWYWWTGGGLLALIVLILWIVAVVDIFKRRTSYSKGQFFAWLIIILVLPIVGTITYFLVNGMGSGGHELEVGDIDKLPPSGRMF
jgi:uncharacterized integral membrane protein